MRRLRRERRRGGWWQYQRGNYLLASVESRYRWKRSSELRRLVNSKTIGPRILARFRGAIREGPLKVRGGEETRGPRGKGRGAIFSAAVENVITRIRAAGERGREVTTAQLGKDNAGIYIRDDNCEFVAWPPACLPACLARTRS